MHILDKIVAQKRKEVAHLPTGPVSAEAIRAARPTPRGFLAALQRTPHGTPALIAEIKRASPSAGVICADFDPVRIARAYEAGGASCLSVLTDGSFFQGSLEDLRKVREAVKVPLLRKDFIIDERQILQAAENGADAILLIVRILSDAQLGHFYNLAMEGGLAALVETHDERELERALAIGSNLIGINNRNLDTFVVDLAVTERLAAGLSDKFVVAESGLHTRADVQRVQRAGAKAILVGESLMRNPAGIAAKMAELVGVK
jgi:indole-3-glycerol phosphate synthase